MQTLGIAHYNLRASPELLKQLCGFYCDIVGLTIGHRPAFLSKGYWLYAGSKDVLHLTEMLSGEVRLIDSVGTFDHVAFDCVDYEAFKKKLIQHQIPFEVDEIPQTAHKQLFLKDPAGNGVELNFASC